MKATDRNLQQVAVAATKFERQRVVALCDDLLNGLRSDFEKKVLIEAQRHLAETKLKLALSIIALLRRQIEEGAIPLLPTLRVNDGKGEIDSGG